MPLVFIGSINFETKLNTYIVKKGLKPPLEVLGEFISLNYFVKEFHTSLLFFLFFFSFKVLPRLLLFFQFLDERIIE